MTAAERAVVGRSWAESNNPSYSSVPETGRGAEELVLAMVPTERARLRALVVEGKR